MKKFLKILFISSFILLPIIAIILAIFVFKLTDIGSFTGGIITYIGTVLLGFVSLRQNTRLHKLERVSKRTRIQFDGTFTYNVLNTDPNFVHNSEQVPSNYFVLSDNKDYKGEKMIVMKLPFKIDGYGLKYIEMDYVKINADQHNEQELFINKNVFTEVVYSVKDKTYQIELAIIVAELKKIRQLIKANDFILSLYYMVASSADVKTVHIAKLNLGNFLQDKTENNTYNMNTISYWENSNVKD